MGQNWVMTKGHKLTQQEANLVMLSAGVEPLEPYEKSNKKWKCKCLKCGREVYPTYSKVKAGCKGCLYCAGKKIDESELPDILKKLNLEPLEGYPGVSTPWKMRCLKCSFEFNSRYDYLKAGRGCAYCSGAMILERDAIKVMQNAGLEPRAPFKSSAVRWECICVKCGQISFRTLHNVKVTGKGCPHCSFAKTRVGQEKMFALARGVGFEPLEPYQTQDTLWKVACSKCGVETLRYPSSLGFRKRSSKSGFVGCISCVTRQKVSNSNQAELATAEMKKAGFIVLEPYVSSKHPWRVRCKKCSMEMLKQYSHTKSGKGCKYCSGNFLNNEQILRIMSNAFLEPLEPYVNAQKPWKSKCMKCERIVKPRFGGVSAGIGGCKYCGPRGLNFVEPAFVYLVTHSEMNSHKIGVSGLDSRTDRVLAHKKNGWVLHKQLNVPTGEAAYVIEQEVLTWLRQDLSLSIYLIKELMPQGGFTETVDASEIDLVTIWAKIEEVSRVKR